MANSKVLVDTSVIIDYFRAKDKKKTPFYSLASSHDLFVSAVTEYELYVGAKTKESIAFIDGVLAYMDVLSLDSAVAKVAAHVYQTLKRQNEIISVNDIFIGATAIHYELTLSTLNQKHFNRIKKISLLK